MYCLLKARLGVSKVSLCIYLVLAFFGAMGSFHGLIWPFLLMTTWQPCFLGCLSLRIPSGVASPQIWGGQIF